MDPKATEARHAERLRSLYVCYLSLEDPLVHTQVIAYLAGLSDLGHTVHLLTFEPARLSRQRRRRLEVKLASQGIAWHQLRYHKHPTLLATTFDVLAGALRSAWLIRRHKLDAFHARNHVPAAMAMVARRLARFRLVFDVRGLMAEEYVDAGRWNRDSVPFKVTKIVERRALDQAEAVIVLTERVRMHLFGDTTSRRVRVIPCCADVERIASARDRRGEMRSRLGLSDETVLVYVGKLTGWYMEREMVEFFALARRLLPELHFLILTQGAREPIEMELARRGLTESNWTVTSAEPDVVGQYLSAADAAISFIRPSFSKISSSPTKVGEYLAAGLPMICIAGVGDVDELLRSYRVGVVLRGWDETQLIQGVQQLNELIGDSSVSERASAAARERLSLTGIGIPAYDAIYREVSAR